MVSTIDERKSWLIAFAFFLLFLAFSIWKYNVCELAGDMGEFVNNPVRVLSGELPYRDFWLLHSPGEVLFPALILLLFGSQINALLIASVLISALIGSASYLLIYRILRIHVQAAILTILVFFNGVPTLYVGTVYFHLYFLLCLVATYFFVVFLRSERSIHLVLSGIFLGLAFFFRFLEVGACFLALLITLVFARWRTQDPRQTLRAILLFSFSVFIVSVLSLLPLINVWRPMLQQLLVENLGVVAGQSYTMAWKGTYLVDSLYELPRNWKGIFKSVNVIASFLAPFVVATIAPFYFLRRDISRTDKAIALLFLLWGAFMFPKTLRRPDLDHLSESLAPLLFLFMILLSKSVLDDSTKRSFGKFAILLVQGGFLIALLLCVPIQVEKKLAGRKVFAVRTEYGTILMKGRLEAENTNSVVRFINTHTAPGEPIFVTSWWFPAFYALTHRKNPTYYDSLIDVMSNPSSAKENAICKDLLAADTKVIIHNPSFVLPRQYSKFANVCPALEKCINSHFTLTATYGRYQIYTPILPDSRSMR